jgi:nucleotide-binding universal stress UspA family protein
MTRLLIAYDASRAARAAVGAAAALFGHAEATVVCVARPPAGAADEAVLRAGLPGADVGAPDSGGDEAIGAALEGAQLAASAGLPAGVVALPGGTPWRALLDEARRRRSDAIVCGTRGEGAFERVVLGSTAASLLRHSELPLVVVGAGGHTPDGPLVAGFDGSPAAWAALRFAAAHLRDRHVVAAHAWCSPVRHTARGRALLSAPVPALHEYAEGMDQVFGDLATDAATAVAQSANGLGLDLEPRAVEGRHPSEALLCVARETGAAAILVGAGPTAAALVHAAALPVIVVPSRTP